MARWCVAAGVVLASVSATGATGVRGLDDEVPVIEVDVKLTDGVFGSNYGADVAIAGDAFVVGAPRSDLAGRDAGAVFLYRPDGVGGYTSTRLRSPERVPLSRFGTAIAASDEIVVATQKLVRGSRAVFSSIAVFELPDLSATMLRAQPGDLWNANTIAVSGTTIAVSGRDAEQVPTIFVLGRTATGEWVEQARAQNPDSSEALVTSSLAMSDDLIVGGYSSAPGPDGIGRGAVTVFERDADGGYTPTRIFNPDPSTERQFGFTVDVQGSRFLANGYLFERSASGRFDRRKVADGWWVYFAGDDFVYGRWFDDIDGLEDAGAVYLLDEDAPAGHQITKLVAFDREAGDGFGFPLAADDHAVLIGGALDRTDGIVTGSAYIHLLDQEPDPTGAVITFDVETDPAPTRTTFRYGGDLGVFRLSPTADVRRQTFDVEAGSYRIRQQDFALWSLASVTCNSGHLPLDVSVDLDKGILNLVVEDGDVISCTFANERAATINTRVGDDIDGDGRFDPEDTWIEGATVHVFDADHMLVKSHVTNASGRTRFIVEPGRYEVCSAVASDRRATKPAAGAAGEASCVTVDTGIGSSHWYRFSSTSAV